MEIKKKKRKSFFVSSISSPLLHCTSAAPSFPSPLVSALRAALMREVLGRGGLGGLSARAKGPRFATSTLHAAQKCILMVCVFYISKCFGDPLGFFGKVLTLSSLPTTARREKRKRLSSRSCHRDGLHSLWRWVCASACFCETERASEGTGRASEERSGAGEERGSGDEWRVSQVLRLSPG